MKLISQPCLSPLRDVYNAYFTVQMNRGATSRKTIARLLATETERKNALYKDILQDTDHRPAPLPTLPWVMTQKWEHVLFMHWPVPEDALRKYIRQKLEIDTFNGEAWIGIIRYEVSGIRMRGLPRIPLYTTVIAVRIRTYEEYKSDGVTYFISLDANKLAVVRGARILTLPDNNAKIRMKKKKDQINYYSKRKGISTAPQTFHGSYWPVETNFSTAEQGTLTHWLAER